MTPLKLARIRVCAKCSNRTNDPAWPWPRCEANNRELNDDAFDGQESDCPAGNWDGVKPELVDELGAIPKRFEAVANESHVTASAECLEAAVENQKAYVAAFVAERLAICDACEKTKAECAMKKNCGGCKARRRNILSRPGMVCSADPPRWKPVAPFPMRKIAWIIPARNEGDEVSRTIISANRSVLRKDTELAIWVIDDGSSDKSCESLSCRVIRTNGAGTAAAQEIGLQAAQDWGADVIGFSDAHMRFDPGLFELLADKAQAGRIIACGHSRGFDMLLKAGVGCRLELTEAEGISAKWATLPVDSAGWVRSPALMGACYMMSADTLDYLRGPTGCLWDNRAGPWGWQEESISIKAGLMGVQILTSDWWGTYHLYRPADPARVSGLAKNRNIAWGLALLFSEETYEKHFRKLAEALFGEAGEREIFNAATKAIDRPWGVGAEAAFLEKLKWDKP